MSIIWSMNAQSNPGQDFQSVQSDQSLYYSVLWLDGSDIVCAKSKDLVSLCRYTYATFIGLQMHLGKEPLSDNGQSHLVWSRPLLPTSRTILWAVSLGLIKAFTAHFQNYIVGNLTWSDQGLYCPLPELFCGQSHLVWSRPVLPTSRTILWAVSLGLIKAFTAHFQNYIVGNLTWSDQGLYCPLPELYCGQSHLVWSRPLLPTSRTILWAVSLGLIKACTAHFQNYNVGNLTWSDQGLYCPLPELFCGQSHLVWSRPVLPTSRTILWAVSLGLIKAFTAHFQNYIVGNLTWSDQGLYCPLPELYCGQSHLVWSRPLLPTSRTILWAISLGLIKAFTAHFQNYIVGGLIKACTAHFQNYIVGNLTWSDQGLYCPLPELYCGQSHLVWSRPLLPTSRTILWTVSLGLIKAFTAHFQNYIVGNLTWSDQGLYCPLPELYCGQSHLVWSRPVLPTSRTILWAVSLGLIKAFTAHFQNYIVGNLTWSDQGLYCPLPELNCGQSHLVWSRPLLPTSRTILWAISLGLIKACTAHFQNYIVGNLTWSDQGLYCPLPELYCGRSDQGLYCPLPELYCGQSHLVWSRPVLPTSRTILWAISLGLIKAFTAHFQNYIVGSLTWSDQGLYCPLPELYCGQSHLVWSRPVLPTSRTILWAVSLGLIKAFTAHFQNYIVGSLTWSDQGLYCPLPELYCGQSHLVWSRPVLPTSRTILWAVSLGLSKAFTAHFQNYIVGNLTWSDQGLYSPLPELYTDQGLYCPLPELYCGQSHLVWSRPVLPTSRTILWAVSLGLSKAFTAHFQNYIVGNLAWSDQGLYCPCPELYCGQSHLVWSRPLLPTSRTILWVISLGLIKAFTPHFQNYLNLNIRKCTFGPEHPAKIQVSLCSHAVWSEPVPLVFWVSKEAKCLQAVNEESRVCRLIWVFVEGTCQ